jgi:hypothetical protein
MTQPVKPVHMFLALGLAVTMGACGGPADTPGDAGAGDTDTMEAPETEMAPEGTEEMESPETEMAPEEDMESAPTNMAPEETEGGEGGEGGEG